MFSAHGKPLGPGTHSKDMWKSRHEPDVHFGHISKDALEVLKQYDVEVSRYVDLADGYYLNWIVFWSTAVSNKSGTGSSGHQDADETPYSLRDSKDYKSAITSMAHVTRQHSRSGRAENMQFLCERVLPRIGMQLKQHEKEGIAQADGKVIDAVLASLKRHLDTYCNSARFLEQQDPVPRLWRSHIESKLTQSSQVAEPEQEHGSDLCQEDLNGSGLTASH